MASRATKLKWLKDFNECEDYPFKFLEQTDKAFCKICQSSFTTTIKSCFNQHIKTDRHTTNKELKRKRAQTQQQLEDVLTKEPKQSKSNIMGREICSIFLATDIPWMKLEHPLLRNFLERNLSIQIPNKSTLRKRKHLDSCYNQIMGLMRSDLKNKPLWISVDETTDATDRAVVNVLLGKLEHSQYAAPYIVNCVYID